MDQLADLPQFAHKVVTGNIRQHQQQLIAAIADQHIAVADALLDGMCGGFQRNITGMVAECIVVQLKVVQVDHGHTGGHMLAAQVIFVITAVVSAGQHIAVQLIHLIGGQRAVSIQRLNHLHHIGDTVHFYINGRGLVCFGAKIFNFRLFPFAVQCFAPNAVAAGGTALPGSIAGLCG